MTERQQPNRDALAKWLFEFKLADLEGYWDAGQVTEWVKDQYRRKADAAILSALPIPATGEEEWEYGFRAPGATWPAQTREEAERYVNADPGVFDLVRRKAGPWVAVTP